jgi:hypothetical protein
LLKSQYDPQEKPNVRARTHQTFIRSRTPKRKPSMIIIVIRYPRISMAKVAKKQQRTIVIAWIPSGQTIDRTVGEERPEKKIRITPIIPMSDVRSRGRYAGPGWLVVPSGRWEVSNVM